VPSGLTAQSTNPLPSTTSYVSWLHSTPEKLSGVVGVLAARSCVCGGSLAESRVPSKPLRGRPARGLVYTGHAADDLPDACGDRRKRGFSSEMRSRGAAVNVQSTSSPDTSWVVVRERGSRCCAQTGREGLGIEVRLLKQHRNELIYFVQEQVEPPGIPRT
jgi:hypothetical protein